MRLVNDSNDQVKGNWQDNSLFMHMIGEKEKRHAYIGHGVEKLHWRILSCR
jgi:hypothetical protein